MENTTKQKRLWIIGIIATVACYFGPAILHTIVPAPAQQKPAPTLAPRPVAPPPPPPIPPALLPTLGTWQANVYLGDRGMCIMRLELQDNHDPTHPISGYSTLTCPPIVPYPYGPMRQKYTTPIVRNTEPSSAVLIGAPENGSIRFHVDKTVGDACPVTDFTVLPFGTNKIAAEWKDQCGGGQLVLNKTR